MCAGVGVGWRRERKRRQLERQHADAEERAVSLERRLKAAQRETASQAQRAFEIAQRGEVIGMGAEAESEV